MLIYFVQNSGKFYSDTFTVYNVHRLYHIADDVIMNNCLLNELSAFPFKIFLQTLKKYVRSAHNPIAQVAKRLDMLNVAFIDNKNKEFRKISTKPKDCCFLIDNGNFAFVTEVREEGHFLCEVVADDRWKDVFTVPLKSKILKIVLMRKNVLFRGKFFKKQSFKRKVVCLPVESGFVLFPMFHEVENM